MNRDSGSKPVRATTSSGVVHESRGAEGNRPATGQDQSPIIGEEMTEEMLRGRVEMAAVKIEDVACALAVADGLDPQHDQAGPNERWYPVWHDYREMARAAINAITAWNSRSPDVVTVMREALDEIQELVSKRQLPITNQVYDIVEAALLKVALR